MLRALVALSSAALLLSFPVRGGGSGAFVTASSATATPPATDEVAPDLGEDEERRLAPPTTGGFPAFLRTVGGALAPDPRATRAGVREVLLSFDDGPDLNGTASVLAALERHGHKAVFFVNGRYLLGSRPWDLARRDLVRKLAAHGHLVANHTLSHKNLCRERDAVEHEIDTNSEVIAYATGVRPLLFRSPYGARCRSLDQALRERDLVQVGWSLDPQEWKNDDHAVFSYVTANLARLRGRAILLLHDTHPAAVRALPRILTWIDQENARVAREGGAPIRIVDYSVFLPVRPVPATGLEPFVERLAASLTVLPGARWARARIRAVE